MTSPADPAHAGYMPPAVANLTTKKDPISLADLAKANGVDGAPIWVAIKDQVFDVSSKPDMYGPGGGYHVFAGRDGSKGLGIGSLKVEDAVPDEGKLGPAEQKVLDDWLVFFQKRYNQIGVVKK